jgi:ribosomal protein S21
VSEVRRRKNESFESLFRRAKKQWQASGKLIQAKKIQFFEEVKSKNFRNKKTVNRLQTQQKTAYLQKIGRLPPEEDTFPTKRR